MKSIKIITILTILGAVMLSSFSGCKKRQYLKYGNQIILINPFTTFEDDNGQYLMTGSQLQCEFILIDKNGDEIELVKFSLVDKKVTINIDWESIKDRVKLKDEHKFITRVGYYDENSYFIDPNNGVILKPDYQSYYATQEITNSFKMDPNRIYTLDPAKNTFVDEGAFLGKDGKYGNQTPTTNSSGNKLSGKWMRVGSCSNANGESDWFQFNSGGKGQSFASDCNSACSGYGVNFYYSYTTTTSKINITWTSVADYCGVQSNTPSPETLNYSISGDIMTINGTDFKKQ